MKGADEESLALQHLQSQGLQLLLRNFRAKGGEIDLVMRDGQTLVIIEVRKRASTRFGTAAETVDARKRGRIVLATRWLLARRREFAAMPVRFDVVAMDADNRIEWIRNAFDAEG